MTFLPGPGNGQQYPRLIQILQVLKVLLIPAVIFLYFALENEWIAKSYSFYVLIAFVVPALGLIFVEGYLRRRFLKEQKAAQVRPNPPKDPEAETN